MPTYLFKCECGVEFYDLVTGQPDTVLCEVCEKPAVRQFTPTLNIFPGFRDGESQHVQKHIGDMTKKIEKLQDSKGYGRSVDRKRTATRTKPLVVPERELTTKELVKKAKEMRRNKKIY